MKLYFLGMPQIVNKAYRVYNKRTMCMEESIHIIFDETNNCDAGTDTTIDDDFVIGLATNSVEDDEEEVPNPHPNEEPEQEAQQEQAGEASVPGNNEAGSSSNQFHPKPWKHQSSHPYDQIISDLGKGTQTRAQIRNFCAFYAYLSIMEPKNDKEALTDSDWIVAMQEELNEFERNKVWHLEPGP